jgi:peptidoglycan/xylan/chitin deacetylase (PgdA/CDA1 family)
VPKLSIVMYHYVRDLEKSKFPRIKGLDFKLFGEQISFLKKNYNFITTEQLIESKLNNEKLPEKAVLLTFDDGYKDHFEYVMPELIKNKIQGSFYIPSRILMEHNVLDVNKIHFMLASTDDHKKIVKSIFKSMDKSREEYSLDSNMDLYKRVCKIGYHLDTDDIRFIKQSLQVALPIKLRLKILNEIFPEAVGESESEFSKKLYMSDDEIGELISNNMHIGSHGHSHSWLNHLDYESQEKEIKLSIDFLRKLKINSRYYSICYPFGGYNSETLEIAKRYGFQMGVSTVQNIANTDSDNMLALPRLDTNDLPTISDAKTTDWFHY